jgi:hypothetical protein
MAFTGEVVGRSLLPNAVAQQMAMNSTRIGRRSPRHRHQPTSAGGVYIFTSVIIFIAILFTMRLPNKALRLRFDRGVTVQLSWSTVCATCGRAAAMLIGAFTIVVIVGFRTWRSCLLPPTSSTSVPAGTA